jgi:hypothetical protein
MLVEQVQFKRDKQTMLIPVVIPDLTAVRQFAQQLHQQNQPWSGIFEGWRTTYTPEDKTHSPANSRMQFVPAEFSIGESEIWHISIAWEDGADESPIELENRRGIGGESHVVYLD